MNPRSRLAGLTMIIVVLSTLGYALITPGIAWPILGLICVAANLLLHGIAGRERYALPRWLVVAAALLIIVWGVSRAMSGFKIDALCECVLALMYIKIWDRRTPGDYAQLLTLSVYLAIGCTVRGEFGPVMVTALTAPVVLMATMLHQVYAGRQRFGRSDPAEDRVWWSSYSFFGLFLAGLVSIAVCAGVVFIFMPRGPLPVEAGMLRTSASWISRMSGMGRVTGFNNRVVLGQGGLISESHAAVAEVRVLPSDDGVIRPLDVLYLRGAVLDSYRDGAWVTRDTESSGSVNEIQDMQPGVAIGVAGMPRTSSPWRAVHLRVLIYEAGLVPVFVPWWPATVEFGSADKISIDRDTLIMKRAGQVMPFSYSVTSYIGTTANSAALTREASERPRVDFPIVSVRRYAWDVVRRAGIEPDPALRTPADDSRAARAIEGHLRREFKYTLNILPSPAGQDPIEWFLLQGRQGHCEYFGSAMVAMCRSVGIPARLVVGYVAAEQTGAGMFVVRQSNAHAWVEAAVDDFPPSDNGADGFRDPAAWHAWRTFDPTPPGDFLRIHQPEPTVSLRFGRFMSSLENAWSSSVLRFDDRKQLGIFGARDGNTSWLESRLMRLSMFFGNEHASMRDRVGAWGMFSVLFVGGGGFVGWLGVRLVARLRMRRQAAQRRAASISIDPRCATIRDRYVATMARAGLPRAAHEPLQAHLERSRGKLLARGGEVEALARACVESLYRAQFAGKLEPALLGSAADACDRLSRSIASEK